MDRRIFGLENEYGVTCTLRGQRRLSPDEVARYLFRRVVSWGRSSNVFLENGARLYLDVGSHPEFATPECDTIEDVVAHDKAGERILEGLVRGAEERLEEEGIRGQIFVFKNNTDSAGNSYGCHENYLVSRHKDFHRTVDVLIPFLVTRQIFLGAGKLTQTPRGTAFSIAQRADHIWEGVSSATTRSRPIINTRDEPHADAERYRRLHVIAGDSNMSEYATYVKVGTMVALLQMIERDVVFRDLTLENPIRAIREVAHDVTCRRKIRLANGRELSALDIQWEYLDRAMRFARSPGFPPQVQTAIDRWEHLLTGLEKDPMILDREVDWVIKHRLLERYAERALPADVRPPDVDDGPQLSRRRSQSGPLLPPGIEGPGRPGGDRRAGGRLRSACPRRRPGRGCAAPSSRRPRPRSGTSPSIGSISSSTIRRSAP